MESNSFKIPAYFRDIFEVNRQYLDGEINLEQYQAWEAANAPDYRAGILALARLNIEWKAKNKLKEENNGLQH
jgi:hypothetical protein